MEPRCHARLVLSILLVAVLVLEFNPACATPVFTCLMEPALPAQQHVLPDRTFLGRAHPHPRRPVSCARQVRSAWWARISLEHAKAPPTQHASHALFALPVSLYHPIAR